MTGYVFLFACAVFACDHQVKPGDGAYYETKVQCHEAAVQYARRHLLKLNRWEVICVEREQPK